MAITFNKKSWKSRISEHPTRRRLTIVDASLGYSLVDVAREEGTVEQVGDTFDKSTMDDLENRIENIAITAQAECDDLQEQIDEMPSLVDVKNIDIGWKESGTRNVSGDTIRVNPFELFSGTVGTKVTGKNLLVYPYVTQSSVINGITYTVGSDGSIEIDGTASPSASVFWMNRYIHFDEVGKFTWSMTIVQGSVTGSWWVQATIYNSDGTVKTRKRLDSTHLNYTFDIEQGDYIGDFFINIATNAVASDIIIQPQFERGSSATSYEPYTESKVINGFIPSAKFFQMGRAFMQEKPVMNFREELEPYYNGATLVVTKDRFTTYEYVDIDRINEIKTMYGYDYDNEQFLASVAGEIYTATGSISCDLQVTDIWGCGANGASEYHGDTSVPVELTNRTTTSANGFPIELMPVNQSAVASLVVGSPVQFRITGELYILLHNGVSLREYVEGMHVSKFYKFVPWNDTRDGVHYEKHYIDIEKGTTFNLSSITTLRNYHFLQAYVDDPDMLDYISWTVTDSNIAITGDDYASNIVLHIDQRRDGATEPDYDTAEDIIINVI